ncbi:hypothetical protein CYLTODRAFT_383261 [Cylindrobasidium torrendii FP15055 ss-10]|uniref:Non-reducing end beta-L-arabinofuranosidase-like GH127 middle domain-containing protein n=1 Tax=Cylindrobasidium torrendii FP15055 ss-10 TaxID=1314674 RepID=A0A0D7AWY9_9AGAR|nr:hypothetical protein CYLTODRAFT_383261 [Cylindrobasidium torrendii FP15055 ss-10]
MWSTSLASTLIIGLSATRALGALQVPLYGRIPTGAIKPSGWQLDQAKVQADGLAGHLMDWAAYVKGSIWSPGGSIEYSAMHEAAPYWFNGMVALAFQLGDERLIGQVREFLDHNLDTQGDDGWIGPEPLNASDPVPRLVWPRYLMLMGLTQYAESDPTQTERIVDSIHRFVDLVYETWSNGTEGDASLGFQFEYQYVRWEELVLSLQWVYDNYPNGKEDQLLETMKLVRDRGYSWKNDWFTDATFPKEAVTTGYAPWTHGVNNAEALKSEALAWRFTADDTDKESTFERIKLLYTYHGAASGSYLSDEHLAGLEPSRGTELCTVVEQIYSLSIIYQIFGTNDVADRAERIAYNALPAGITHDWWAHQYDQQPNQIWSKEMDPPPFGVNGPLSNVFGFEPNYPCCTVNHPQGFPKFWANSFYTGNGNTELIHVFLGPLTYSGSVNNAQVEVRVDTLYPFGNDLSYTITSDGPFTFKIRIPGWATDASSISVSGADPTSLSPDSENHQSISVEAGETKVSLSLGAELSVDERLNGAVSVSYGGLLYAVELAYNDTVSPGLRSAQALGDVRNLYPNAPAEYLTPYDNNTVDHILLPTENWALAIDTSTLSINDKSGEVEAMPFYAWESGAQPITFTALACDIAWDLAKNTASVPPQSPNACLGDSYNVTLVPYGAAKLRVAEIPTASIV